MNSEGGAFVLGVRGVRVDPSQELYSWVSFHPVSVKEICSSYPFTEIKSALSLYTGKSVVESERERDRLR